MSESEYGKFRAAVFDAIANAKARAPHENVKFGMTKEVEVGRSDPNKQPRLVLYATQKSADGVFQVDIETLKTQLEKGDLGKGPDLTENVKKLFTFHFEPEPDDDGDIRNFGYGGKSSDAATTSGGHGYHPTPR